MKVRVILVALMGCLLFSACGAKKEAPEAAPTVSETTVETTENTTAKSANATDETDVPNTEETPAVTSDDLYANWEYYDGYTYMKDGQPKYWIEFDEEFTLHCMFRSGDPEFYEVVYTLYPDWDAPTAQELTIAQVVDPQGNDMTDQFEQLSFAFSMDDVVIMQVKRDESTLAGGADDNILTGDYVLRPKD